MTAELISRQTRDAFREFLSGWTLREIQSVFDASGVQHDAAFRPAVSGERRTLVERYYHTLDFADPRDARKLLAVYENILQINAGGVWTPLDPPVVPGAAEELMHKLLRDGIKYEAVRSVPAGRQPASSSTITPLAVPSPKSLAAQSSMN